MRVRALALCSLLLLLSASDAHAQDAAAILQRTADRYRQLRSLAADFDQVVSSEMIGTFKSRGALAQAGASRLAMRFSDPKNEAIVIDGTYVWIYTPSTAPGQVLRVPIASASGYGVNLLGWLLDRPAERYHASYLRKDTVDGAVVDVLKLTPTVEGLPFTSATLWLARSDALPRRIEVTERSGNRRTLTLSHLKPDASLPADTFVFTPPKGVKVVSR
jgi:outer membrane lipoprotein carrier protein